MSPYHISELEVTSASRKRKKRIFYLFRILEKIKSLSSPCSAAALRDAFFQEKIMFLREVISLMSWCLAGLAFSFHFVENRKRGWGITWFDQPTIPVKMRIFRKH
jgi:hypothetical protein